jgi:hypothetical protein
MIDHPVRGPLNAWLLDALDGYMHLKYGSLKVRLFGVVPATVVDLGAARVRTSATSRRARA